MISIKGIAKVKEYNVQTSAKGNEWISIELQDGQKLVSWSNSVILAVKQAQDENCHLAFYGKAQAKKARDSDRVFTDLIIEAAEAMTMAAIEHVENNPQDLPF